MAIFILIQFHSDPRELFVPDSGWGISAEQWERLGDRLGLNDPLWKQYVTWIGRTLRGDLGISLARDRPVTDLIKGKIGATVQLAVGGWIFAVLLGIPLGVLAAVKRGTFWDYFGRSVAIVGQAAPPFVTALVAIWIFAVVLGWFPAGGRSPDFNWKEYVLPCVALGWGAATSLMRLTTAYAMLVNGGKRITPTLIDRIQDRNGRTIFRHDNRPCRDCATAAVSETKVPEIPDIRAEVADPESAYQMVSMLQGVVLRGTGRRVRTVGKPLAGKTGTTNQNKDAWFIGFSPDLVAGVFIGFDQPRNLGWKETGSRVAVPAFKRFMAAALADKPATPFRIPRGVRLVRIDGDTGLLPSAASERVILEAFKPGTEPTSSVATKEAGAEGLY